MRKALIGLAGLGMALTATAAHAQYTIVGLTCGFVSSNDPTALIDQNPDHQTGVVTCGPIGAANPTGIDAATVTACFVTNSPSGYGTGVCVSATVNCPTTPVCAVALASTVTYTATATDNVYICTTYSVTGPKGLYVEDFDDDGDATNGNQCSLATSAGA